MITREMTKELREAAAEYPVVTVLGPRQSGKTTLAKMTFPNRRYFSLEEPDLRLAADLDPRGFLNQMPDGGILDEIQRLPKLLSYIQGIVDDRQIPGLFILTGSHQPELHEAVSQTLAGRTAILTLLPFSFSEISLYRKEIESFKLIVNGSFPRLYDKKLGVSRFYNGYVQTYIERDVRALINLKDLTQFQQFLSLIAGRVGQIVNYSSLSSDVGVSSTTIKQWISVLKASYIVFELKPFFHNIRKRVVKSPKIYFFDTGLLCHLLGINTSEQLLRDPLRGALYENLFILEVYKSFANRGIRPDLFFYRDTHGNEVDLIIQRSGGLIPIEIKSASTFTENFIRGINHFRKLTGDRSHSGQVIYNGEQTLKLKNITITNPFKQNEFWKLMNQLI